MRNVGNKFRESVWRTNAVIALFWVIAFLIIYLAMNKYLEPKTVSVQVDGSLYIEREKDGHFYVDGQINGEAVRFLIDTGASYIAVTEAFAQRAGLDGGQVAEFRTANGVRKGRLARAQTVSIGPLLARNLTISAGYTAENVNHALLGQNFLRQFDVRIRGDLMIIQSI